MFLDFSNGNVTVQLKIDAEIPAIEGLVYIRAIKKITEKHFAYFGLNIIHIRDIKGNLVRSFKLIGRYYYSLSKLSDSLLIASFRQRYSCSGRGVQIWNIESGVLVKEILECDFVGTCSFGFLIRRCSELLVLHAYDRDGNFIGVILTDAISSEKIRNVTQLGKDLYCFLFEKSFKLIKCKFKK